MNKKELIEEIFVPAGTCNITCVNEIPDVHCKKMKEHTVSVGDFYITSLVTQKLWKNIMGNTPWKTVRLGGIKTGDDLPAICVNWWDVQVFIEKINELTGKKYRMPTDPEWEYAAHCSGNLGIRDMDGIIWEWVGGVCAVDTLLTPMDDVPDSPPKNCRGGSRCDRAPIYYDSDDNQSAKYVHYCCNSAKCCFPPTYSQGNLGFRLAYSIERKV